METNLFKLPSYSEQGIEERIESFWIFKIIDFFRRIRDKNTIAIAITFKMQLACTVKHHVIIGFMTSLHGL